MPLKLTNSGSGLAAIEVAASHRWHGDEPTIGAPLADYTAGSTPLLGGIIQRARKTD